MSGPCGALCAQVPQVTGSWVDHPNPEHIGLYDPRGGCPEWAEDFNCLRPYPPAQPNPDLAAREFRKARITPLNPTQCPWNLHPEQDAFSPTSPLHR